MAIKDTLRGGADGEHPHGAERTSYPINGKFNNAIDPLIGDYDPSDRPMSVKDQVVSGVKGLGDFAVGAVPAAAIASNIGYGYSPETVGQAHNFGVHSPVAGAVVGVAAGLGTHALGKYQDKKDRKKQND
jgi:hypothetical protein